MSPAPPFPALMARLQGGDQQAAALVFHTFARRLVGLASRRLGRLLRHKAEPEDVVQSAFRSFFRRQRSGQFDLPGWDALWDLLVVITLRKCCNRADYFHAACRDARREVDAPPSEADSGAAWQALDREPTPDQAVQLSEVTGRLLEAFEGHDRTIVEMRLQGYAVLDISARLGCSERKVYRVLEHARALLHRLQSVEAA